MTREKISPAMIDRALRLPTPSIIYDSSAIDEIVASTRRLFSPLPGFTLAFSVKANRHEAVLRYLHKLQLAASVASITEFQCASNAGFKRIFATAPAFSAPELKILTENNVCIALNSLSQVELFGRCFPNSNIGIRVRLKAPGPLLTPGVHDIKSRFGIDPGEEKMKALLERYRLTITQLHIHFGDLVTAGQILWVLRNMLALSDSFEHVQTINLGGGWYPLFSDFSLFQETARQIVSLVNEWKHKTHRHLEIVFEPGAFLVIESGYLTARVLAVDSHPQLRKTLVSVDVSAWNLLPWTQPRVVAALPERNHTMLCRIVGNTCYEEDIIVKEQKISVPQIGDRLIVDKVGAYVTSNARGLHGYPIPGEHIF